MKKVLILTSLFIFIFAQTPMRAQTVDTCQMKIKVMTSTDGGTTIDTVITGGECNFESIQVLLDDLNIDSIAGQLNLMLDDIDLDSMLSSVKIKMLVNYDELDTLDLKTKDVFICNGDSITGSCSKGRKIVKVYADGDEHKILENIDDLLKDIDVDIDMLEGDIKTIKSHIMIDVDTDSILQEINENVVFYSDGGVRIEGDNIGESKIIVKTMVDDENGHVVTKVMTIDENGNEVEIEESENVKIVTDCKERVIKHNISVDSSEGQDLLIVTGSVMNVKIEDFTRREKSKLPADMGKKPENKLKPAELNFYPNPNNGQFTLNFELPKNEKTQIAIFDLSGKELYRSVAVGQDGLFETKIDISEHGTGTYILRIEAEGKWCSKKIVVE